MSALFIYMLKWACCLTLLYSLYRLLLSKETFHCVNRIVLLGILVVSPLLPEIPSPFQPLSLNGESYYQEVLTTEVETAQSSTQLPPNRDNDAQGQLMANGEYPPHLHGGNGGGSASVSASASVSFWSLLPIIYLIGVASMWILYLLKYLSLFKILRRSRLAKVDGIPSNVHVLVNEDAKIPFSWFRWIVLSNADLEKDSPSILTHELTHVRKGHSMDMLLADFTVNMLWWLPVSWMLRSDLRNVHEYQADGEVVKAGNDRDAYQQLIIDKATGAQLMSVANSFNQSSVKKRLAMMFRTKSGSFAWIKLLYLLPVIIIAVLLFAKHKTADKQNDETLEQLQGVWMYVTNHPDTYSPDSDWVDVASHYIFSGDTLIYPSRCDPVSVDTYLCEIKGDTIYATLLEPSELVWETFKMAFHIEGDTLFTAELFPNWDEPLHYVNIRDAYAPLSDEQKQKCNIAVGKIANDSIEDAIKLLQQVQLESPYNPLPVYQEAVAWTVAGNQEKKREALEKTLRLMDELIASNSRDANELGRLTIILGLEGYEAYTRELDKLEKAGKYPAETIQALRNEHDFDEIVEHNLNATRMIQDWIREKEKEDAEAYSRNDDLAVRTLDVVQGRVINENKMQSTTDAYTNSGSTGLNMLSRVRFMASDNERKEVESCILDDYAVRDRKHEYAVVKRLPNNAVGTAVFRLPDRKTIHIYVLYSCEQNSSGDYTIHVGILESHDKLDDMIADYKQNAKSFDTRKKAFFTHMEPWIGLL